jgi:branched-chain amino acid transport system ATP-binding protein
MLRLEHISVAYGKHEALHDVTLDVERAKTTVILGANGAGKTTLLKTIAGLVRARPGGRILFEGRPIEHVEPHEIVAAGIALVPEGRRLFGEMTVIENLRLGAYPERARADEREQLEKQLALFPRLAERRNQLARTMSGGEQQMLAIARGLMSEPKVLLLDEPSLGLSPLLVKDLFAILRKITVGGQSVVLVEQNAHQSLRLADLVYVLENGHIRASGTAQQIEQDQVIQQAYLGRETERLVAPAVARPLAPASVPTPIRVDGAGGFRNPDARSVAPPQPEIAAVQAHAPAADAPAASSRAPGNMVTEFSGSGGFVNPLARSVAPNRRDSHSERGSQMANRSSEGTEAYRASGTGQDRGTPPPVESIARTGGFVNPFARAVESASLAPGATGSRK